MNSNSYIEVYPVGVLMDLKHRKIQRSIRYLHYQFKARNWRAIKSSFNGYLAEWHYPPEMRHSRCGHGWTKRRALRDLGRHIVESNVGGGNR